MLLVNRMPILLLAFVVFVVTGCGIQPAPQQTVASPTSATPSPPPSSSATLAIRSAQLIEGSTGLVIDNNALSLTTDGGHTWTGITPPGVPARTIRGVYFLNARDGWAVSSQLDDPSQLQISDTTNGGTSWQTSPLGSANGLFGDSQFIPAYIDFVNSMHGWVVALIASGSGVLPRGDLFRTTDGGATWQQSQMPLGGRVEFVNSSTGWLAGGQQGEELYVTSDGGQTWTAATVPPPSGFAQDQASYAIPSFTMASNVILATFGNGADSVAGFYQTSDGGTSWRLAANASGFKAERLRAGPVPGCAV